MKPGEQEGAELFTSITGIQLRHRDGAIDFWSTAGDVAVEVMLLTSESYREGSELDRDSLRLTRRWYFVVPVNRLGEPTRRAPARNVLDELEDALVECERLGIWEPTRIGPTFEPGVGNVWPEPQATVWRLLGGRAPAASGLAVEAGRGILPGITISPMHGGPSVPDADGIAIELNALIADGHSLAKHVAKTQAADATERF